MNLIHLLPAIAAAVEDEPNLTWLGPAITVVGGVIVAVVGAAALVWRRRQDKQDAMHAAKIAHEPDQTDTWEEVRKARAEATKYYDLYRLFQDLYYSVQSALRHLARKVHDQHPDIEFDKDVVEALAVKPPEPGTE